MLNKIKHPVMKSQTVSEASLDATNAPMDASRLKVKDKKPLINLWIACSCLPQPENPAIWSAYRERAAPLSRAEWFGSLCVNTHEEGLLTKQRFKEGDKELRSETAALLRGLAELRCARTHGPNQGCEQCVQRRRRRRNQNSSSIYLASLPHRRQSKQASEAAGEQRGDRWEWPSVCRTLLAVRTRQLCAFILRSSS